MDGRLPPMFDLCPSTFPHLATVRPAPDQLAPLQQSALYAQAVRLLGGRMRPLDLPDGRAAWLIERRVPLLGEVAMLSRGPRHLSDATVTDLDRATGALHLIVNAEDGESAAALARAGFWRVARPRQIAELRLHPSPDTMAAAMTGKWRNRLRHGLAQGLRVECRIMPPDPRHWLLLAESRAARQLGYRPLPPVMIAALAAAGPEAGQLLIAHGREGPVAAMLFFRHGRMATYQVGWSTGAGRAASAGNLLMWRAMVALQAMGVERIDLGHADPVSAPGLTHFKQGTGARLRSLGGTWLASRALPRRGRLSPPRPARAAHATAAPPGSRGR
jgi:hypothetical protein